MTTANDCSGRGRHNTKGRWNQNTVAIWQQRQWHHGTSHPPPPPVDGRHHSWEEGCGLETLLSCGNVDNDNNSGANDNVRFQTNVPPLIKKQRNANFRRTEDMHFNKLRESLGTG